MIPSVVNGSYIHCWKSKGLPEKELIRTKKSNHSINPNLDYYGIKPRVEFNRGCLKQGKVTFNQGKELNI